MKSASHNRGIIGITISATVVVMLLGIVFLLRENLQSQQQKFRGDLQLEIFLRDDTSPDGLRLLTNEVASLSGYESSTYRDKTEAFAQMQATLGSQVLPSSGYNPFPNSLIIKFASGLSTFSNYQAAESKLKAFRCVEDIRYPKALLISQESTYAFFDKAGLVLLALTLAMLLLVMWIGIRRMALARSEQTRVLLLLGAGWKQIALPLLANGLTSGMIAALAGLMLLYLLWHFSAGLPLQLAFLTGNGLALVAVCTVIAGVFAGLYESRSQMK